MSEFRVTCLPTMLVGLLWLVQPAAAQTKTAHDWPVFRGNALQSGVAESPLPDVLAVQWSFKAPANIEGSPIISDHTVFVGASNGMLYALDLADGKKKWEYQTAGILAAPAAHKGAVYVGDVKGAFHCVHAATGKKRWSVTTDADILAPANFAGDRILFGSNDHHLYCVTNEGRVVWMYETKEKVRGAPAIAGNRVLVAGCDQMLHVVDLASGRNVATVPLGGHVGASVAVHGDVAYVGNMANQFLAVDWQKGVSLWQFEAKVGGQPFFSSPAVTDDLVVVGSRDKRVRAWRRHTGAEAWTFPTQGRVDSSPVIVGKRVLATSLDGHLYVLDLTHGTQMARIHLGPLPSSAAVASQRVVVATVPGNVICLGARK